MIPSVIERVGLAPGEPRVFDALRDGCPDSWTVLHSLDIPRHQKNISGEMDFLILIPGCVAIGLEVKSHTGVRRPESGLWHLGRDEPSSRGPFRQASDATHAVRKRVTDRVGSLAQVPFISVVGFTHCRFEIDPTEWEPWQVFDESQFLALGLQTILERAGKAYRLKLAATSSAAWFIESQGMPTKDQCEQIARMLRPSFEQSRSPKARQAEATAEIQAFTEEQFDALDEVDENRRVVFNGGAGTGKTLIALEAARRAVASDKRVLLCCFNSLLGDWLTNEATPLGDTATVGTLHSVMLGISGLDVPVDPPDDFFSDELPRAAIDQLVSDHDLCGAFDLIVIDEAQDLFTDAYLDVLDLLLKDGLRDGELLAFGDFKHQAIYAGYDTRELLSSRTSAAAHRFSKNCRNRPSIGSLASSVADMQMYASYLRNDDGTAPTIQLYSSRESQATELAETINQFRSEHYQMGDITVLSLKATDAAADSLTPPTAEWLARAGFAPTNRIRTATVHAFKGLESPVVIVTDIEGLSKKRVRQLLYVGASRATERLALLVHENDRKELGRIIMGDSQ
ncbi:NERD domain-containing protein [Ilumatobacter sp.]|uniref:nuclease-related domain-containing DEAD/DEAH box helicase n=1 Tax=Ilumatobacter sp. TaxID=1967498 RepID=UPI0037527C95